MYVDSQNMMNNSDILFSLLTLYTEEVDQATSVYRWVGYYYLALKASGSDGKQQQRLKLLDQVAIYMRDQKTNDG